MVALCLSRSLLPPARRGLAVVAVLALVALGGCVAYPAYGPGYYGGYYAPGYAYAPPVVVGGWGHSHGWHGGGFRGGRW